MHYLLHELDLRIGMFDLSVFILTNF